MTAGDPRRSEGAAALIRDGRRWLARWNAKWGAYNLVAGHRLAEESFRDCIRREVTEELGLREPADFSVAAEPAARLEYTAFSRSAGVETLYRMEIFPVQLAQAALRALPESNVECRWLTEAEIRGGRAADGRPVSETMAFLLTRAGMMSRDG